MIDYDRLAEQSLSSGTIDPGDLERILEGGDINLLRLLDAAYAVRHHYFGNRVRMHVLNNAKSGGCSEDCGYCAQSGKADGGAPVYPPKTREQDLAEAKTAYENGAYRYCMVFSGRRQRKDDIRAICDIVSEIRSRYRMEVCVSAGFLDREDAAMLRDAGVARYNHNINTSAGYYREICTTHSYEDRLDTLRTARNAGLEVCSGVIVGMGETNGDIVRMIDDLRSVDAKSIPVNFFKPVAGSRITRPFSLTPEQCLRILCAFRLMFPSAEIRAAGFREHHMRSLQALALYPANGLFAQGYLTEGGDSFEKTKQMIADAGFVLEPVEEV